jgi:cell shape-determining protein MreC
MRPKRRSNSWVLAALVFAFLVLIFFEPSLGWQLRERFMNATSASPSADSTIGDAGVTQQNEILKAELAKLTVIQNQLPTSPQTGIPAMVYSRYPFNFKSEFLVDVGAAEGVATGSAAVFQGIFIGQVKTVFANSALVQTVFDDNFKLPVRIGNNGYDGLLTGDPEPSVGSITKNASLEAGDIVYTAGAGMPYGLPVGEIAATSTSPDGLFEQASLGFAYDLNSIQTVIIVP